ncbi:sugar-transfer associated ATP-grasp domain-containing protein, partial [Helicobacter trogontum]|uniref:sugar-transfer associated ATP-grasp domain-containing protein n=1 Tax=Helicobacter trogontum TaxID=50960 RepID=UPI0034E867B4
RRLEHTLGWHTAIYNTNKHCPLDVRYLDNPFYYQHILPYFNPRAYTPALSDKNLFDALFAQVKQPKTLARRINGIYYCTFTSSNTLVHNKLANISEIVNLIKNHERLIIKPTRELDTGSGKDVKIINSSEEVQMLSQLLSSFNGDFIIQEFIAQHPWLENLNCNSVNTFRIMTFLYKGRVHVLPCSLLVGGEGVTSNGGHYRIGITENGTLRNFVIKGKGEFVPALPNIKMPFNKTIPHFSDIVDTACALHLRVPFFGLIGWDFTLDINSNPLFIEFNPGWPSAEIPENTNSPLFGELSEEIYAIVANFYK